MGTSSLSSISTRIFSRSIIEHVVLVVLSEVVLIVLSKGGCWLLFIDSVVTVRSLLTRVLHKLFTVSSLNEMGLTKTCFVYVDFLKVLKGSDVVEDAVMEHVSIPAFENGRLILISVKQGIDTLVIDRTVVDHRVAANIAVVVVLLLHGFHLGHVTDLFKLVERKSS